MAQITEQSLQRRIIEHADKLPESAPLCPGTLLHLGERDTVAQSLSQLARSFELIRIWRDVYMRPIETRYGQRLPSIVKGIKALSELWDETIVLCGGAAANNLRLTTQNPIRLVYLTSGPDRRLRFGKLTVELRHTSSWKLVAPHSRAGAIIRALDWLGPEEVDDHLETLLPTLTENDLNDLISAQSVLPNSLAKAINTIISHALGILPKTVNQ